MESFLKMPQRPANDTDAAPAPAFSVGEYRAAILAYELVEPELASVEEHERVRVTVNISYAVALGLGAIPAIRVLEPTIFEQVAAYPRDQLVRVERYGLAAWYAHILAGGQQATESAIAPYIDEVNTLRKDLLVAGEVMAHFGLIAEENIESARNAQGHLQMADALSALSHEFIRNWLKIEKKGPVPWSKVERAAELSTNLLKALGPRFQPGGEKIPLAKAIDNEVRAFSLFHREYDVCRRAVSFLRWEQGDVDDLVPSLFSKPRTSSKRSAPEAGPETTATAGEANGPAPPQAARNAA